MVKLPWKTKMKCMAFPGMVGLVILYLIPGTAMLYYMVIDNVFQKNFVGGSNFLDVLENDFFRMALKNTVEILLLCLAATVFGALILSLLGWRAGRYWIILGAILLLPFFIPTVLSVEFWEDAARVLLPRNLLLAMFVWRNIGPAFLLMEFGCLTLEQEILDAAKIDGANGRRLFCHLLLPHLLSYAGVSVIFLIVQFLGIFRETYLLFGTSYPPDEVYLLQHYLYNHFRKLNYPLLSAASFIFVVWTGVGLIAAAFFIKALRRKKRG